jgi:hypothetical protein
LKQRREIIVKQGISIGAVLIAMSIAAAGAPAVAAPTGLGSMISQQKHEKTHRTNWIQVVRHKVMGMVAVAEGGIAEAGARKAKMKAAMAAKAKQGAASKPQI